MKRLTSLMLWKLTTNSTRFASHHRKEEPNMKDMTFSIGSPIKKSSFSNQPNFYPWLSSRNGSYSFSTEQPSQTDQEMNQKVSLRSKIKDYLGRSVIGGLLLTLVGGIIEYEARSGLFYSYIDSFAKKEAANILVKKGKTIEDKILATVQKQFREEKESFAYFQYEDYSYKQILYKLLHSKDHTTINFIDCFIGNGVGNNLKRTIRSLIKGPSHKARNFGFNKLYYLSLGDPPIYDFKDSSEKEWHVAEVLHQLLNCLIDKETLKQSILIVDQVQVLENLFNDQSNNEKLNLLFNQLNYLQRQKNLKIFLVCNDATFYSKLMRRLEVLTIDSFKYQPIGPMSDKDIHEIVACRTKFRQIEAEKIKRLDNQLNTLIKSQNDSLKHEQKRKDIQARQEHIKKKSQEIMQLIVGNHNNVRQIMRLLKAINLDLKPDNQGQDAKKKQKYFVKLVKKSLLKPLETYSLMQQMAGCLIFPIQYQIPLKTRKQFQIQKLIQSNADRIDFDKIYEKVKEASEEIINSKVENIYSEILYSVTSDKNSLNEDLQAEYKTMVQKIKLLYSITHNKYNSKQAELHFRANSNIHQLEAYRSLNTMQILHGLKFTSKSYEKACRLIIQRLNLKENIEEKFKPR